MKIAIKIEEYLSDTNQIVVRFCDAKSSKPINEHQASAINCSNLDCYNLDTFTSSIVKRYGIVSVKDQYEKSEIIESNKETYTNEELDLNQLVGQIIHQRYYEREINPLKMRKIEL